MIVEWKSSDEFAPVREIDLLVGVHAEGHIDGIVYTAWRPPFGDPTFRPSDIGGSITYTQPGTGKSFTRTPLAPYWFDPTESTLAVNPYPGEEYEGRRVVHIDPAQFPVGEGVCVFGPGTTFFSHTSSRSFTASSLITDELLVADPDPTSEPPTPTTGTAELPISPQKRLEDMINGGVIDPPPPCDAKEFQNAEPADRMFIRAAIKNRAIPGSDLNCVDAPWTVEQTQCVYRRAYTNPVWVNVARCANPFVCNIFEVGINGGYYTQDPGTSLPVVHPALYDTVLPTAELLEVTRDADSDRVSDDADNCPFAPNPAQSDVDPNGRGDACECGDQNGDGTVTRARPGRRQPGDLRPASGDTPVRWERRRPL